MANLPPFAGAAARAAIRELGGIFQPQESTVAVGVATVPAVPYNPNRIGLVVTNNGVTNITLRSQPDVISGVGLLLLGNGATMRLNWRDDGDVVASPFYAVSDVAGGALHVYQMIEAFQTKVPVAP